MCSFCNWISTNWRCEQRCFTQPPCSLSYRTCYDNMLLHYFEDLLQIITNNLYIIGPVKFSSTTRGPQFFWPDWNEVIWQTSENIKHHYESKLQISKLFEMWLQIVPDFFVLNCSPDGKRMWKCEEKLHKCVFALFIKDASPFFFMNEMFYNVFIWQMFAFWD